MPERRLPAEWEPQDACLLTWPHDDGDWPDLPRIEGLFLAIADAICRHERLIVACLDAEHARHVTRILIDQGTDPARFRCLCAESNDSWARDHGPLTAYEDGRPRLCDFGFDGWGGKYPAGLDNTLTRRLHAQGAFGATPLETIDLVVEGGNIDSDGQGTALCNGPCLHDPRRNPGLTPDEIDERLCRTLGIERLLCIENGRISGDDTDGHIDMLARFCDPRTIVYSQAVDEDDPDHAPLAAMADELAALRDAAGRPYHLHALPAPSPRYDAEGRRLPASYANFLVINGAVLVPQYGCPADAVALALLSRCFPDRQTYAIDCRPAIEQAGSLHCLIMHLPKGVLDEREGPA